jgi:D-amino-acid oxidase
MRKGGLRLEKEDSSFAFLQPDGFKTKTKPLKVVHCYGAGGSGYKLSWGAARRVVELVGET